MTHPFPPGGPHFPGSDPVVPPSPTSRPRDPFQRSSLARAASGDPWNPAPAEPSGSASTVSPSSETNTSSPRRRPRRRRKKASSNGLGSSTGAPASEAPWSDDPGANEPPSGEPGQRKRSRRRRGRRGERSPEGSAERSEGGSDSQRASGPDAGGATSADPERDGERRRRRSRRKKPGGEPAARARRDDASRDQDDGAGGKKRSRRRGSRGGRRRKKAGGGTAVEIESIPGEIDELPDLAELPDDAVLLDEEVGGGGRDGRGRRSKRVRSSRKRGREEFDEDDDDAPPVPRGPKKARLILVNAGDPEETRVCVVEENRIVDLQMSVKKQVSYVHDIYRGRVVNLEPAIGAAFVDFGEGRNGFLHASDVLSSYGDPDWSLEKLLSTPVEPDEAAQAEGAEGEGDEPDDDEEDAPEVARPQRSRQRARPRRVRQPIEKLLKKGQMVAVQITKDAIGDKGPTLTTYVSIPGRYLVLMPSLERTGVSRKIEDDRERRRLKRILSSMDIPEGMGVIVRTAGIGKTKAEIKRDLDYLLVAWEDFARRLKSGRNPAPLYQESDVAIRTMRDLFTSETEAVVVDDPAEFDRMVAFTKKLMPEFEDRVKLHDGQRPLLHTYGVEQDFEKIFARRVELPSGGSIVIDQTEALVAIDVNSGRTREKGAEFEDIALKTNLEAAPEIARQIRLRDLGGIIVLDYIDMMKASSRRAVERATRDYLKDDRARSKIGRISQFGLLEMTRQRLGPGLSKLVFETCRRCRGSGRQRSASSRAQSILRRLGTALLLKGFTAVEVRAHPEVIEYLKTNLGAELAALEEKNARKLVLLPVPDQVEDSVLHYLRADGREVRPGGRRKR